MGLGHFGENDGGLFECGREVGAAGGGRKFLELLGGGLGVEGGFGEKRVGSARREDHGDFRAAVEMADDLAGGVAGLREKGTIGGAGFEGGRVVEEDDGGGGSGAEERGCAAEDGASHEEGEEDRDGATEEEQEPVVELEAAFRRGLARFEEVHGRPADDFEAASVQQMDEQRKSECRCAAEEDEVEETHGAGKSEIQNPKFETNPNEGKRKTDAGLPIAGWSLIVSDFGFRISNLLFMF
jgi:hypothetical protein